jgi:hypothetical protein
MRGLGFDASRRADISRWKKSSLGWESHVARRPTGDSVVAGQKASSGRPALFSARSRRSRRGFRTRRAPRRPSPSPATSSSARVLRRPALWLLPRLPRRSRPRSEARLLTCEGSITNFVNDPSHHRPRSVVGRRPAPIALERPPVEAIAWPGGGGRRHLVYRRDQRITRPLAEIGLHSREGIPCLAPELVLLFKATHPRAKDESDFANTISYLNDATRHWLAGPLRRLIPGTPGWLG